MKIRDDILQVMRQDAPQVVERGLKLEPEEAPAQRVLTLPSYAKMNTGAAIPAGLPDPNTTAAYQATAGEFAVGARQACQGCRHFNRQRWLAYKARMERSLDLAERQHMNAIRAGLLETQNASVVDMHPSGDGDMDVESALASLGICDAYTEHFHEYIYVHPMGGCPVNDDAGRILPVLFQPRDHEAKREASRRYDNIIAMARGRMP